MNAARRCGWRRARALWPLAKRRQNAHDAAANASRGAGKLLANAPGPRFQRGKRCKPNEEKTTRPNEKSAFSLGNTFFLQ